jgi:hypothetical protein
MARKKMGNKSLSPSLAAFGFTSKKRNSEGGEVGSPPKRSKINNDNNKVVDLSNDKVVDLSQDDSSKQRRDKRTRIINLTNDDNDDPPSKPSPQRSPPPNSLGLQRVPDTNQILSMTTVAAARMHPPDIPRLFPGAVLGRSSTSSSKDSRFIDLRIPPQARGISRKHLTILRINGLEWGASSNCKDEESVVTSHSVNSLKSTTSTTNTSPTMLIKVVPHPDPDKSTMKIKIHRTRRNKHRFMELKQGECKTLKCGDVIEFLSDGEERWCFCLVPFYDSGVGLNEALEGEEDGATACASQELSLTQDLSTEEKSEECVDVGDEEVKLERIEGSTEVVKSSSPKKLVKADPVSSRAKSESEQVVNESVPIIDKLAKIKSEEPTSDISPTKEQHSTEASFNKLNVNPAQSVKKGDDVRVVYQLADAFGLQHEEW